MFESLQKKWKVSAGRLLLIIVCFATGGSLTGYAGRKLIELTGIKNALLWIIVYIIIITIIWPFMVLIVSIPFGQFPFFRNYIRRIGTRISGKGQGISPPAGRAGNKEQGMLNKDQ